MYHQPDDEPMDQGELSGFTEALVAAVGSPRWDELPESVRHAALRHVIDTVAAVVAGAASGVAQRAAAALTGPSSSPSSSRGLGEAELAWLTGVAAHALEVDDGYREGSIHPGACVVPAAAAVAATRQVDGPSFLEAVVAGYETIARISRAAHPRLRIRGFHPTGAVGVFGAASAVAHLAGLSAERHQNALALAASASGGLFAFLSGGAEVKALHAGQAARDGLLAARLAETGLSGPPDALGGQDGFFQAFTGAPAEMREPDPAVEPHAAASIWAISSCYLKPYPCCRHLHPAIEAVLELRVTSGVAGVADVDERDSPLDSQLLRIDIETYGVAARHITTPWRDPATARLSLRYVVAHAAVHGAVTSASFDEAALSDPLVGRVAERVRVSVDPSLDAQYPATRPARVRLSTPSGTWESTIPDAHGSPESPLSDQELSAKFSELTAGALGSEASSDLLDRLWHLDQSRDVGHVLARPLMLDRGGRGDRGAA